MSWERKACGRKKGKLREGVDTLWRISSSRDLMLRLSLINLM